jgi:hypothetical protein
MKSPFPGMDPYIEATDEWPDFHDNLIGDINRVLAPQLPSGFYSRLAKRSYIALAEEEGKTEHIFQPDIEVLSSRQGTSSTAVAEQAVAAADDESIEMRATIEDSFEETFIDIFEQNPERRLITSIEVLSPSNKRPGSESRGLYLRKRQALMMGEANLVEIDLLRGGARLPMLDAWPKSPYILLVSRKEQTLDDRKHLTPRCRVWKTYFDRPIPVIPVPLTKPHADLQLDLQPLVEEIYTRARYGEVIDYSKPLVPPLSREQSSWLKKRLRDVRTSKPATTKKRKSKA